MKIGWVSNYKRSEKSLEKQADKQISSFST